MRLGNVEQQLLRVTRVVAVGDADLAMHDARDRIAERPVDQAIVMKLLFGTMTSRLSQSTIVVARVRMRVTVPSNRRRS